MNVIDKMIGVFSPRLAYERMSWRSELERNFNSAKPSRLPQNFRPAIGDAETINKGSRDRLRAIARNLENNSDISESVVTTFERNVIGSGITLQIKSDDEVFNKKVETLFKEWSSPSNCEVTGGLSFLDVQNIIMRRLIYDGGILIKKVIDKSASIPFKLQLIEVDELDKSVQVKNNTTRCFDGVEVNLQNKPIKYHIKKYDWAGISTSSEAIEAKDIIFLRRLKRSSQIRELSEIARTIDRISSTDEYLVSVAEKERVAACFAAFIKKNTPSGAGLGRTGGGAKTSDSGAPLKNITPGMIQYLSPGEEATVISPNGQASDTEKFVRTQIRLLSSGVGLSYETVARDLSQVNYSSARQNLLEDKETYK
ncbi:MAG: phage portal protein, partial [Oscillospiraceae bacterium]